MIAKLSTLRQCIQQLCYPKINISIKSNHRTSFHNNDSKCNFILYLLSTTINGCVWTGQLDRGPALENMFWFAPPLSHECDPQNKLFQLPLYSVHASLWQQQQFFLLKGFPTKLSFSSDIDYDFKMQLLWVWVAVHLKSTSIHPNIIFNLQKLI